MSNNTSPEWQALKDHKASLEGTQIKDLFDQDPNRFENFHVEYEGLVYDYSKTLITTETIENFSTLASACDVEKQREQMFSGTPINTSENRPVLHTALRSSISKNLKIDGENIASFVLQTKDHIKTLSEHIRNSKFTDIVHIGIGGSALGPEMVCRALSHFADGPNIHFLSNIDADHTQNLLGTLDAKTTAFIIVSKTFTTLETMSNAEAAKQWLGDHLGSANIQDHFMAVTSDEQKAMDFGLKADHILPLRPWIGGRYSLWSAVGLSIAASLGFKNFEALLSGAQAMDRHFQEAPLKKNMPVLMAFLSTWHRSICGYAAQAILPYAQALEKFPSYIQQLDMESNGKSITKDGTFINTATGPIVFGETGTNAQHAFMQLLHQGTEIIPCDFIVIAKPQNGFHDHHIKQISNALAQSKALMQGAENPNEPHRHFPGNRPSTTLLLNQLDPYHLGMLLAAYEHKIFVQGIIWNINSFDQWGVELGKALSNDIQDAFQSDQKADSFDSSTKALIDKIKTKTSQSDV